MSEIEEPKLPPDPDIIRLRFSCLRVTQPIGDIFVGAMPHSILSTIASFDVRRVIQKERDVERYLGIQRPLDDKRVKQLSQYVNYADATFPTAIIIAIEDQYVQYDDDANEMTISNVAEGEEQPSTAIRYIARVIDGQLELRVSSNSRVKILRSQSPFLLEAIFQIKPIFFPR